ncbi:MAG TPA: hypothetical protein PLA94_31390 [Myxococcota bacterium]|nr:hypothetical protein [Myxococcota bacterium]
MLFSIAFAASPPFRDADDLARAIHLAASMVDADNLACEKAAAAAGPLPADEKWLDQLGVAAGAYSTCLCEASLSCRSSSASEQKAMTDNLRAGLIAKLAANGRIAPELAGPGADLFVAWSVVDSSPLTEELVMEQLRGMEGLSSERSYSSTALTYQGVKAELWTANLDPRYRLRVGDAPAQPLEILRLINEGNLRLGTLRVVMDTDGVWLEGQSLEATDDFRAKFLAFVAETQRVRPGVDAVLTGTSTAATVAGGW